MDTSSLTPEQIERMATRRVKAKLGWYLHATIYVLVNIGLAALAYYHGKHWNVFPLVGWGLGLAIHGAAVWFKASITGFEWHERMIEKERSALAK